MNQSTPSTDAPSQPTSSGPAGSPADEPLDDALRDQALLDTAARVSGGLYIYFVLWLVITLMSGLAQREPLLVAVNALVLGALGVWRAFIGRRLPGLLAQQRSAQARRLVVGPILINGLYWGLLSAASVYFPALEPIRWAMLVAAVGMCSAGTMSMAINPVLKTWYPAALIIPVSIATLLNFTRGNVLLSGLTVVYAIYAMHASRIVQTDYWQALRARRLLEDRARELERISLTDTLTQVPNRLSFDRQYQLEWARACRENQPLSVMVLDLDFFKNINDSFGHPCGDLVLKRAAAALRAALHRATDSVARYGGEEFAVLLPNTDQDGARAVAERLLDGVRRLLVLHEGQSVRVTCSIGVACCRPSSALDAADLIRRADQALYAAKQHGRDQMRIA